MVSKRKAEDPWHSWDSCHVLGARERSAIALDAGLKTTTTTLDDGFPHALLLTFAQRRQVPLDSVLKLAWCIAAGAYAGVQDVCIGVRSRHGQSLVRCQLDSARTVGHHLSSLEEVLLVRDEERRGQSLDKLAASSGLFDSLLSIGADTEDDRLGASLVLLDWEERTARVSVRHPSATADDSFGRRAATLFSQCVAEIVANPDKRLSELDILPPDDGDRIRAWNSKDLGTYDACLHEVIHQRAKEAPDDPAVCAWDGDLAYRELDALSSQLAWRIRFATGSAVAFLFRKSKWTVVALLAILKAGASAVALNHDYPVERSRYILEFTKASVLLTGRDVEDDEMASFEHGATRLVVDDGLFADTIESPDDEDENHSRYVSATVKPEDVAYIQFTSGSTGQPKGILLEHRTYLASALSQHTACRVDKGTRVLQFASHSFDAILVEVLTPLLAGACVCIPSEESRLNDLAAAMRDMRVMWMGVTPTLARVISPQEVPTLETLCLWGEAATTEVIEKWADAVELINIYGPSETSAESTWHSFSKGPRNPSHLGKALPAVNTWVVRTDNRDKLAPIGAVGELVIQGPTVSRGYLRDDARNAASFVRGASWLPQDADQRTYYTGDYVRYTADGQLEFWGRRDTQIKIRGHRIELGEVEYQIGQSGAKAGVTLTSVVEVIQPSYRAATHKMLVAFIYEARDGDGNPGEKTTASFIEPASDRSRATGAEIEHHLKRFLPSLSVPSLYIPLTHIPMTASGKADRRRLRMTVEGLSEKELSSYSSDAGQGRKPESTTEILVARLWSEVLGIEAQTVHAGDSFFWLGGNSILAMRLAVAARGQGLPLTVSLILNNPRLQQLSAAISKQAPGGAGLAQWQAQVQAQGRHDQDQRQRGESDSEYHAFSNMSGIFVDWFKQLAGRRIGCWASEIGDIALATDYQIENLAWTSLRTRGGTNYLTLDINTGLDEAKVDAAIRKLVSHHQILRTAYFVHQRRVYQVVKKTQSVRVERIDAAENVAEAVSAVIKIDSRKRVDVSRGINKFWLVRGADGLVTQVVMRVSHLQHDGVTQIRWCKEFGLAYNGRDLLPTASYAGYTHFAATHDEEGALKFWRALLSGSSMTSVVEHESIPWRHVLDGQVETLVDTALLRSSPDITHGTAIKAAWALVLAEMAGQRDVVFGSVVCGRNATWPGVEHVAGACIENIPVRVRLAPGTTRLQLLQEVQRQYFEAVEFENFGLRRIVGECTGWRPWERLSTLVEYENLGEETERFEIDEERWFTVREERPPADRHDVTVYSMPSRGQTFIALDFCTELIPEAVAQGMLDRMVHHIRGFHEDVHAPVQLAASPSEAGLPSIPLPLPLPLPLPVAKESELLLPRPDYSLRARMQRLDEDEAAFRKNRDERKWAAAWKIVTEAWLDVMRVGYDEDHERTPFYEIWGNLIAAYALSRRYEVRSDWMGMEEVLEWPDQLSQVKVLYLEMMDSSSRMGGVCLSCGGDAGESR